MEGDDVQNYTHIYLIFRRKLKYKTLNFDLHHVRQTKEYQIILIGIREVETYLIKA